MTLCILTCFLNENFWAFSIEYYTFANEVRQTHLRLRLGIPKVDLGLIYL